MDHWRQVGEKTTELFLRTVPPVKTSDQSFLIAELETPSNKATEKQDSEEPQCQLEWTMLEELQRQSYFVYYSFLGPSVSFDYKSICTPLLFWKDFLKRKDRHEWERGSFANKRRYSLHERSHGKQQQMLWTLIALLKNPPLCATLKSERFEKQPSSPCWMPPLPCRHRNMKWLSCLQQHAGGLFLALFSNCHTSIKVYSKHTHTHKGGWKKMFFFWKEKKHTHNAAPSHLLAGIKHTR